MAQSVEAVDSAVREERARFLDTLYRQYASALLRFISRQNVSPEEAKEIVQETYCRLQQIPQVETLESPRGYLFRTAINLARDTKRQRRRRQQDMSNASDTSPAEDIASEAPTAYQVLKGEQELAIIRQAITELNPTCRQVFILHRFGNATYGQIAEQLGVSVSMIEKHVSAALAHLKSRLDDAHSGGQARRSMS
jgi:RNA polymerase sigma factor (sigma-70 family)